MKPRQVLLAGAFVTFLLLSAKVLTSAIPSKSASLGACTFEATSRLASLRRLDDEPISHPSNAEWFGKHAELVTSCMLARGFKLDKDAIATHIVRVVRLTGDSGAISSYEDSAVQIDDFWNWRMPWQ